VFDEVSRERTWSARLRVWLVILATVATLGLLLGRDARLHGSLEGALISFVLMLGGGVAILVTSIACLISRRHKRAVWRSFVGVIAFACAWWLANRLS
jgi:hypothetical protein